MNQNKKLIDLTEEELRRCIDTLCLGLNQLAINPQANNDEEAYEECLFILKMQKELVAAVHYAKHNRFYSALWPIDNFGECAESLASSAKRVITGRCLREYTEYMKSGNTKKAFQIVDELRLMGLHD